MYFVHSYYPASHGIAIHLYNLIKHLKKHIDYRIITSEGIGERVIARDFIKIPGFSSLYVPHPESIYDILTMDYDIIHVHGYGNLYALIGAFVGLLRGKKVVWTIHGIPQKGIFFTLYDLFARPLLKRSIVIGVSSKTSKLIKQFHHIPNGVELKNCMGSYKEQVAVGYIGRLDPDKRVDRLIKEVKSFPIVIVGPDEGMRKKLEKMAEDKQVTFLDPVPYEEISQIYCKLRYVVLPSKYEGFPMVMLESLAHKRPFVSTPVGEVPMFLKEMFGDKYKKYIINGTIEETLQKLEKEDLDEELEQAYKKLEKYSWENIAKKTLEVYKHALGERD